MKVKFEKILILLLVTSIVLSALGFVACNTTVNNADFNEYSQKATAVLKAQNSTQTTTKEAKRNDGTLSSFFAEIDSDNQKIEVYYQSAYRQYCELTFKIPLAVGYAYYNAVLNVRILDMENKLVANDSIVIQQ